MSMLAASLKSKNFSCVYWLCPGSIAVKHSTHNPKIEGSIPAPGTGRVKMDKKVL